MVDTIYEKLAMCTSSSMVKRMLEGNGCVVVPVDHIAANLWARDYPNGGSVYRTWESTPHHDKEIYRKEASELVSNCHSPRKDDSNE